MSKTVDVTLKQGVKRLVTPGFVLNEPGEAATVSRQEYEAWNDYVKHATGGDADE